MARCRSDEYGENPYEYKINTIMKNFLQSKSDTAAADAARRFDTYYAEEFLPSDPLMRFKDDKGMAGFFNLLYELIFDLARRIPHNDPHQDKLLQHILELRKLPPRVFKIWGVDSLVYIEDYVFSVLMEDNWNGASAIDDQESCDEWLNFSAYLARLIEAGVNDGSKYGYKYPTLDIRDGVEKTLPPGIQQDCRVKVAAQYILLAGRALHQECVVQPTIAGSRTREWVLEHWELWMGKFGEIARFYEGVGNGEMAGIARGAHDRMVALHSGHAG